ncbi:MAG: hypothetical protein ACOY4Q_00585 [Bacillota bacterium]
MMRQSEIFKYGLEKVLSSLGESYSTTYELLNQCNTSDRITDSDVVANAILPFSVEIFFNPLTIKIVVDQLLPHVWKSNPYAKDNVYSTLKRVWEATFNAAAKKAFEELSELGITEPFDRALIAVNIVYSRRNEFDIDNYMMKFALDGVKEVAIKDDSKSYVPFILYTCEYRPQRPATEINIIRLTDEIERFVYKLYRKI